VRLVGADGQQIGIRPLPEALQLAREQDLDLVEVAPMANPPVCRIMDYGKFKYEESQKAKESRRKASNVSIKEMKYRPKIGTGDFDTKTRKIAEFLGEGHKVKVTIMFRGREVYHPELGMKILNQVADTVARTATSEPGRTQSTRQARIDRADTPVIVLNATGVNGLARQVADRLQSTGYQAAVDNSTSRPQTLIGYKSGADAAAKEIGKLLDVPSGQIQPMPQDLVAQAGSNAVIVVIGADKASD